MRTFPFVNLFLILFFLVINDNLISAISAVTSELFNSLRKSSCMEDLSGRFLFFGIVLMVFKIKLSKYSSVTFRLCDYPNLVALLRSCVKVYKLII